MIIGTFENLKRYKAQIPCIDKIIDFIADCEKGKKEAGKYEIDGENLFANIQSYTSKLPEDGKTEAHRTYADLQYIIHGTEEMLMAPVDTLQLVEEKYSQGKDIAFYKGELTTRTVLSDGCFAILFPEDAHCPGVMHEKQMTIEKLVFKIKL